MINIFNSPIDPISLDEFADRNRNEEAEPVFDAKRRKPQVTYHTDGRRVVDGVVENEVQSNVLWTTTISRGVANEWKDNATGGRVYRAKKYLWRVGLIAQEASRHHGTALLVGLNLLLLLIFLYVCRMFPFS